jgi:outer membrane murein-binding lipoprotein Lpp
VFDALLLAGCDQSSKVSTLENKVASIEKEMAHLKQTIEFNQMVSDWDKVAYLTPGSD